MPTTVTVDNSPAVRIALYCRCGKPIAGFAGIIRCQHCGTVYSVAAMEIKQT